MSQTLLVWVVNENYARNPPLKISNKQARHIALYSCGLHRAPMPPCNSENLSELIKYLGYVQLDPIQVVAKAHDHILWSRNSNYKPKHLETLLEKDRLVFEHFCHDACVLPMDTLPYWANQFGRKASMYGSDNGRKNLLTKAEQKTLIKRITQEGPLSSRDFKVSSNDKKRATWSKPAHKQTLDHLWLTGKLAVSKRVKFTKYYDLAERVYPQKLVDTKTSNSERLNWLSVHAFNRLGFATHSELKRFWDVYSINEIKAWCIKNSDKINTVSVESYSGDSFDTQTLRSNEAFLNAPPAPSGKVKIVNPFDPIMRDRKRLMQLFGFDYRIEMYVPANKRIYGYYVYPLLEYDRFIGRLEVRHDRKSNVICVDNLWPEPKVSFGKQRMEKLRSELERLKRFCGAKSVEWSV